MATILIKLYNYHDDDLLQLRLNGLDLGFVFTRALEACFHKEKIRFALPKPLVLDKTRRKNSRVRITLNDKTQNDLCTWLEGFEPYYRNQAIKNIARMYLDGNGISCFNAFFQSGKWAPASTDDAETVMIPYLHKKTKTEDPEEWLDRISKGQTKRGLTGKKKQEAIQKMRETPLNELLNSQNHTQPDIGMDPDVETDSRRSEPETGTKTNDVKIEMQKQVHDAPDYGIMQAEKAELQKEPAATPMQTSSTTQPESSEDRTEPEIPSVAGNIPEVNLPPEIPDTTDAEINEPNEDDDADDNYDVFQMFERLKGN